MAPWPTVLGHSFDFRGVLTCVVLLGVGDKRLPAQDSRQSEDQGVDRIISARTLPAVLRVTTTEVVCKGYLLDAKTQVVNAVRFVSFTVGSSDFSHKLGQTVVELSS